MHLMTDLLDFAHARASGPCFVRAIRRISSALICVIALLPMGFPVTTAAVTLDEFVTDVVSADPEIREQLHRYRQVLQDLKIAASGWQPSLDLSLSYSLNSRQSASNRGRRSHFDSSEFDVTVTQNLFSGFETTAQIEEAQARIDSAAFRLYDIADNMALNGVRAYVNALEEGRLQELAAQNVESHERVLAQIDVLNEQGLIRRSDVRQTQGRLARAHASLIAQQDNLEDAVTQLHRTLGRYINPKSLIEVPIDETVVAPVEQLIDVALKVHPALASAEANISAARAAHTRSRATDYPRVDLTVSQQLANDLDGPTGRTEDGEIRLQLSYNLFRGGADKARRNRAASDVQAQSAFMARVRRQVIEALRLAWSAHRALTNQLPFLTQHAEKSLETVELYREEFIVQKRDLIDLLDAENELNQALTAETEAHYELIVSQFRIHEALGKLFPVLGIDVEINRDRVRIASLDANGTDSAVVFADRDNDSQPDESDHCDNSSVLTPAPGCIERVDVPLGYAAVAQYFGASDDTVRVPGNEPTVIVLEQLLENDAASSRDKPVFKSVSEAANGTVMLGDSTHIIYTPNDGYFGTDSFSYTIGDRRARTADAQVNIVVQPASPREGQTERLYFKSNRSKLTRQSAGHIRELIQMLKSYPDFNAEIRAYSDSRGRAVDNAQLADRRAESIQKQFVTAGIQRKRILTSASGTHSSIDVSESLAEQRRAEVRFYEPGER